MLFPKRQDYIGPFTGNALGSIVQKEITREFLIDSIYVIASATLTAGAATANPDRGINLIKRITLNVTDGARTRNVIDASGPGLVEWGAKVAGTPRCNCAAAQSSLANTNVLQVIYPIFFGHPQMNDPERSMFVLPCNRFTTNPLLTVYFATQADLDINSSATLTATAGISLTILINRVQIGVDNWPVFDTEIVEQVVSYPSSGANQIFELPTPGSFSSILIRGYSGASTALTRNWNVTTNGDYRVSVLGTNLRRIQPYMVESENEFASMRYGGSLGVPFDQVVADSGYTAAAGGLGCLFFDFLSGDTGNNSGHADFGSVLDTNGLIKTGARAQIIGDIAGGTGVQNKYLWHRIFGDLSSLKAANKV